MSVASYDGLLYPGPTVPHQCHMSPAKKLANKQHHSFSQFSVFTTWGPVCRGHECSLLLYTSEKCINR